MHPAYESRHQSDEQIGQHRHPDAYAALVLDGHYEELSADGRYPCRPGVLTVHPAWHLHADRVSPAGALILNWPMHYADGLFTATVTDADALARLARRSPMLAAEAALEESQLVSPMAPSPWLVSLTAMLATDTRTSIRDLAGRCGVSVEHAVRACRNWFGCSPGALRREWRLQRAMEALREGEPPSRVAAEQGFSDQPHLTRLLKRATGLTPGAFSRP